MTGTANLRAGVGRNVEYANIDFIETLDFCLDTSRSETLWRVAMTTFARVLSRAFTARQSSPAETAMMLIIFGLVGLVVSVLLATYGLDLPVDYSFFRIRCSPRQAICGL